jgi:lipopolysaccharide export system protein LptC
VAGIYEPKTELLSLSQYIVVVASAGYEARLTEAKVDMRKGLVVSDKPVEVLMLNGVLTANRLEVIDNGVLVRFDGGVELNLTPNAPGSHPASDKTAKK